MAAAKTHDFEIPAAVVRELIRHGIPRHDIRHEITPDSNSSAVRADIVAITHETCIIGIEIKSACDTLRDGSNSSTHTRAHSPCRSSSSTTGLRPASGDQAACSPAPWRSLARQAAIGSRQ